MSHITKFPLRFSSDGKVVTSKDPRTQFDLFTRVRPFTLVRKPTYGIDGRGLLQSPINNLELLLQVYLINLREKIEEYFQNISINRAVAGFNKEEKRINISIFVSYEEDEAEFQFSIDINQ